MPYSGTRTQIITRNDGAVINLLQSLDTATAYIESKDIDGGDPTVLKSLDEVVFDIFPGLRAVPAEDQVGYVRVISGWEVPTAIGAGTVIGEGTGGSSPVANPVLITTGSVPGGAAFSLPPAANADLSIYHFEFDVKVDSNAYLTANDGFGFTVESTNADGTKKYSQTKIYGSDDGLVASSFVSLKSPVLSDWASWNIVEGPDRSAFGQRVRSLKFFTNTPFRNKTATINSSVATEIDQIKIVGSAVDNFWDGISFTIKRKDRVGGTLVTDSTESLTNLPSPIPVRPQLAPIFRFRLEDSGIKSIWKFSRMDIYGSPAGRIS